MSTFMPHLFYLVPRQQRTTIVAAPTTKPGMWVD